MTAYKGRIVSGGRPQIPADVRKELGLADGGGVRMEIVDGEWRVQSYKAALMRVRAIVRQYVPKGMSLADELIADRRADAARE